MRQKRVRFPRKPHHPPLEKGHCHEGGILESFHDDMELSEASSNNDEEDMMHSVEYENCGDTAMPDVDVNASQDQGEEDSSLDFAKKTLGKILAYLFSLSALIFSISNHFVYTILEGGSYLDNVAFAGDYNEAFFEEEPPEPMPFEQDEPTNEYTAPPITASVTFESTHLPMISPPQPEVIASIGDPSVLESHYQNKHIESTAFEQGISLFAELTGLSRHQYSALREVLYLIKDETGETHREIKRLPTQLSTLKNRMRTRLPLMNMRRMMIPVDASKLPTYSVTSKRQRIEILKVKAQYNDAAFAENSNKAISIPLHFIDPLSLFKNLLSSGIRQDMHQGPGIFVDNPTEIFHSRAWISSIRTSNGIYPHLQIDGRNGAAIFPSDFIAFRCQYMGCGCWRGAEISEWYNETLHIGRVCGFGYDHRAVAKTISNEIFLQIQEAYEYSDSRVSRLTPKTESWELIIDLSKIHHIPEENAYGHLQVHLDYTWGEVHDDPVPSPTWIAKVQRAEAAARKFRGQRQMFGSGGRLRVPRVLQPYPKHDGPVQIQEHEKDMIGKRYIIRRVIQDYKARPICHTHPVRADLEIQAYGREIFTTVWDRAVSGTLPIISCPVLSFIDGFGVFRNSYRSLMGLYCTPAGLKEEDRGRAINLFPIALGPHGSDFRDVIKGLRTMADLDRGVVTDINGEDTRICVFTLCYTGDMPQQAENAGFKGPRANKFCRVCFEGTRNISEEINMMSTLDADIVTHGRYHMQTKLMHQKMNSIKAAGHREQYGTQWGISDPHPPLETISPALDLILTRPPDAAHSEYGGLTNALHLLLRDAVLTKPSRFEYAAVLRSWPFPPGSQRLQSPIYHLSSYNLSSHARWSIIVPGLLRNWLRPKHVHPMLIAQIEQAYGEDGIDFIVSTYASAAKSNNVLMGKSISAENRNDMPAIIRLARIRYTQLSTAVSRWLMAKRPRAQSKVPSNTGSRAVSIVSDPEGSGRDEVVGAVTSGGLQGRALQHIADTLKPNVHLGIHYPTFAEEYAMPRNFDSLHGEDFHRSVSTYSAHIRPR